MREPPVNLPSATLCVCLRTNYELTLTDLTFLPLGHDSSAWVYSVLPGNIVALAFASDDRLA
jgi:hypothetical protein